jgi:hypothetical protein
MTDSTSVNLHDLENVLEDLTATVFWGGMSRNFSIHLRASIDG